MKTSLHRDFFTPSPLKVSRFIYFEGKKYLPENLHTRNTQPALASSQSTMETPEQCVKPVQS